MDLFTDYQTHSFSFPTADGGAVEQQVLGWSQGGCTVVWSDLLPRILALHGKKICAGKTVLELGAGCGLVGLLAARYASRVDITDGDEQEAVLIASNIEAHAPASGCVCSALHLNWGSDFAAAAVKSGELLPAYDLILSAQVVYVPAAIGPLVETVASLLTADGVWYLYNDAVACMSTQSECRALLDAALAAHDLRAEPVLAASSSTTTTGGTTGTTTTTGTGKDDDDRLHMPMLPQDEGSSGSASIRLFPHADAYMLKITRGAKQQQQTLQQQPADGSDEMDGALSELVDTSAESSVRRAAAMKIGAMRALATAADVARVVEQLGNSHNCDVGGGAMSVRRAALLAFTELARGDATCSVPESVTSCVPAVSALMGHADDDTREMAVRAMSALGAHADVAALACALEDAESEDVRSAAADSLVVLRDVLTAAHLEAITHRLTRADEDDEDDEAIRTKVLHVVAGIGVAAASQADVVAASLADEATTVRAAAAKTIGALGEQAAAAHVDTVAGLLEDDDARVREAAVSALGALGAESHAETISELLGDPDRGVRTAATAVLKRWGAA